MDPVANRYLIAVDEQAPALVRRCVRWEIARWQPGGFVAEVQLLVSEAVTNVLEHTSCAECAVDVLVTQSSIRVSVRDCEPASATLLSARAAKGLGLRILSRLARDWGCDVDASGKSVWFECDLPRAPRRRKPGPGPIVLAP